MLLLVSESNDLTTDKVVEWLMFFSNNEIVRINDNSLICIDRLSFLNSDNVDIQLIVTNLNTSIKISNVDFFWYRRGNLNKEISSAAIDINYNEHLLKFLNWEWKICHDFIIKNLMDKESLGSYFKSRVNKLENLQVALKCGFTIPETVISEELQLLLSSFTKCQQITKPISEAMLIADENSFLDLKTKLVEMTSNKFFPSLFQEKIEKWIELRVFVSYNEVYGMAIFSQNNSKTNIDYRNYDKDRKNRFVPFVLPQKIKQKVFLFMEKSGLDTGSIDFILTPNKEYIFLEINPAGNIEMVSEPCNYYLEKRIAEQITERMPS